MAVTSHTSRMVDNADITAKRAVPLFNRVCHVAIQRRWDVVDSVDAVCTGRAIFRRAAPFTGVYKLFHVSGRWNANWLEYNFPLPGVTRASHSARHQSWDHRSSVSCHNRQVISQSPRNGAWGSPTYPSSGAAKTHFTCVVILRCIKQHFMDSGLTRKTV